MAISTCKEIYNEYRNYIKGHYDFRPDSKEKREKIKNAFPLLIDIYNKCQKDSSEITNINLDSNMVYDALKEYYYAIVDGIRKYGISKEQLVFFDSIIDEIIKPISKRGYSHKTLRNMITIEEIETDYTSDMDSLVDKYYEVLKKVSDDENTIRQVDMAAHIYDKLVPDNLKNNPELIKKMIDRQPEHIGYFLKFVKDDDNLNIINSEHDKITEYLFPFLSNEDYEYILDLYYKDSKYFVPEEYEGLRRTLYDQKNSLVNKLRERYGKAYEKYAKDNKINPDDNAQFLLTMLRSNVLSDIHQKDYFTRKDVKDVDKIIDAFEFDDEDCTIIRRAQKKAYEAGLEREINVHNYILKNKNKDKVLDQVLEKLNITKDNFFDYIKSRKYLPSEQKTTELAILSKHFKCNYISIYDIVVLLQEMSEKEVTIDKILEEKGLEKKIFYDFYNQSKKDNPVIYELIKEALYDNKLRGFKKLFKFYCSICDNDFKDREAVIVKYNKTPEDLLTLFNNTPFYDDVYLKLASLCEKTIEEENIKKM